MVSNVMIDIESNRARWFDFENVHDERRSISWRRADDVRALLASCLAVTDASRHAELAQCILDVYGDLNVIQLVRGLLGSTIQRSLPFHLGQAPLSYRAYSAIGRTLGTP
jgi:hypothetical protein